MNRLICVKKFEVAAILPQYHFTFAINAESEDGLCKNLSGPSCISNTNYSEKCNWNTKYKIYFKSSKIQITNYR